MLNAGGTDFPYENWSLLTRRYIRSVVSSVARSMGIVRRACKIFDTPDVIATCFRSYFLSQLDYCAPAWCSFAKAHLRLLDGVIGRAERLYGEGLSNLDHCRRVYCLCMLYKIYNNSNHAIYDVLVPMKCGRVTRSAISAHEQQLTPFRVKTEQYIRSIPSTVRSLNGLPSEMFTGSS